MPASHLHTNRPPNSIRVNFHLNLEIDAKRRCSSGQGTMVLGFTLSEEGVAVLHDALTCMFKFSDDVCLEAKKDKVWPGGSINRRCIRSSLTRSSAQLILTTLNISKSAYICFTFAANRFFSHYHFEGNSQYRDRFFCQLYVRVRRRPFSHSFGCRCSSKRSHSSSRSCRFSGLAKAEARVQAESRSSSGVRSPSKMDPERKAVLLPE
jgi:hypothetical protein